MKILKKLAMFSLVMFSLGVIISCSSNSSDNKISVSTNELYQKGVSGVELPNLQKITESELDGLFGIDSSGVSEYSVYISPINVQASEVAIFKFDDEAQKTTIEEGIASRLKDLDTTWKTYLPDQYDLVKNANKFEVKNVMGYVIAEDASKIVDNIKKAAK